VGESDHGRAQRTGRDGRVHAHAHALSRRADCIHAFHSGGELTEEAKARREGEQERNAE
jgi:hypothetical protein